MSCQSEHFESQGKSLARILEKIRGKIREKIRIRIREQNRTTNRLKIRRRKKIRQCRPAMRLTSRYGQQLCSYQRERLSRSE